MKRRILLMTHENDTEGIIVEYEADHVSLAEIQKEIAELVSSPRIKKLTDEEIEDLILEYDEKIEETKENRSNHKEIETIHNLLHAAKAYWEEQGINIEDTEAVIAELMIEHPDWKLEKKTECSLLSVWS